MGQRPTLKPLFETKVSAEEVSGDRSDLRGKLTADAREYSFGRLVSQLTCPYLTKLTSRPVRRKRLIRSKAK
jgi:hypothetical protein